MRYIGEFTGNNYPDVPIDKVEQTVPPLRPDPQKINTWPEMRQAFVFLRHVPTKITLRELSRRCSGSPTAPGFCYMLNSSNPPTERMLRAYIRAVGLADEMDAWMDAWNRVIMGRTA